MGGILVIGNGFDIHHEKQTRYSDFLDFVNSEKGRCFHSGFDTTVIPEDCFNNASLINFMLKQHEDYKGKKTWIDMEGELKRLIHTLTEYIDEENKRITKGNPGNRNAYKLNSMQAEHQIIIESFKSIFEEGETKGIYHWKKEYIDAWGTVDKDKVILKLSNELSDISNLLTIYLREIEPSMHERIFVDSILFGKINPQYVISFNYTETCEKLYGVAREAICYVHGRLSDKNVVLGYDDVDKSQDDILFKKYYRRLVQKTDIINEEKIFEFLDQGDQTDPTIYFFGHSLDVSDEDILIRLLNLTNRIIIFVCDDIDQADKIRNLFRLLKKEIVIRKIHSGEIAFEYIAKFRSGI